MANVNASGNATSSSNKTDNVISRNMFNLSRNQIIIIVVVVLVLLFGGVLTIDLGGIRTMLMNLWNNVYSTKNKQPIEKSNESRQPDEVSK